MTKKNPQGEVWIFAEQQDGKLNDVALELCGKARALADVLGVKVGAVLPGYQVAGLAPALFAHGVDRVYLVDDPNLRRFTTSNRPLRRDAPRARLRTARRVRDSRRTDRGLRRT